MKKKTVIIVSVGLSVLILLSVVIYAMTMLGELRRLDPANDMLVLVFAPAFILIGLVALLIAEGDISGTVFYFMFNYKRLFLSAKQSLYTVLNICSSAFSLCVLFGWMIDLYLYENMLIFTVLVIIFLRFVYLCVFVISALCKENMKE